MPMYFYMTSNYTVNDNGAKSVAIKTLGYERCNSHVSGSSTHQQAVTIHYSKLKNDALRNNCWEEPLSDANPVNWLLVVWNRRPGMHLTECGMLVLDAFKGQQTPKIKAAITDSSMNTLCSYLGIQPHFCRCQMS